MVFLGPAIGLGIPPADNLSCGPTVSNWEEPKELVRSDLKYIMRFQQEC